MEATRKVCHSCGFVKRGFYCGACDAWTCWGCRRGISRYNPNRHFCPDCHSNRIEG